MKVEEMKWDFSLKKMKKILFEWTWQNSDNKIFCSTHVPNQTNSFLQTHITWEGTSKWPRQKEKWVQVNEYKFLYANEIYAFI